MSAKLPIIKEPHPQPLALQGTRGPLWVLAAGRQSVALALWGYSALISNQADISCST